MIVPTKRYLSDGAFAEYDGRDIILTTSNGIEDTNRVVLDDIAITILFSFIKEISIENAKDLFKEETK